MQRVQLDGEWKTYMPEIASELPELLTAGGTAKVTQLSDRHQLRDKCLFHRCAGNLRIEITEKW
jgi:hypothetical protein